MLRLKKIESQRIQGVYLYGVWILPVYELNDRTTLPISDPVNRRILLSQPENVTVWNAEGATEDNPDNAGMGDQGKGLSPMAGQQHFERAENPRAHLSETFSVRKLDVGGTLHPG